MTREEAINIVRNIYQTDKEKEALETLIPELTESEDERIRQKLIRNVSILAYHSGLEVVELSAWLEKQKEQKPKVKIIIPKFRVGDIIQRNPLEKWDTSKRIISIDECGYDFDYKHLGKAGGGCIGYSFEEDYELTEQTPQWAEEDEKMLSIIIGEIEAIKVQTSTQFEKTIADEKIDWLKSLRPSWKPSEEQMEALETATHIFPKDAKYRKELELLQAQFKKLI